MDVQSFIWATLGSAGTTITLLAGAGWLLRTWLGARLREGLRHGYDSKLEQVKAELRDQGESNLALLRSEIDRQADKLRIAAASFSEVQKATLVKKVEAIEVMWLAVLTARSLMPASIITSDVLTREELLNIYSGPLGPEIRRIDFGLSSKFFGAVDHHRPFLGEVAWAQFATFQGMMSRVLYLFRMGERSRGKLIWYEDANICRMVTALLGEAKYSEFENLQHSRLQWLNQCFELQLIQTIDLLLSGQQFSSAALNHAEQTLATVLSSSGASDSRHSGS